MRDAFIVNYQLNAIKKHAESVLSAVRNASDRKVVESVKAGAEAGIAGMFPHATSEQLGRLGEIVNIQTPDDYARYVRSLEPHLAEFPTIDKAQITKLFPKSKKLKLPDLAAIDYRYVTYLNWVDIATNRLFLVYPLDGKFVGIEGKYTPTNKKNYCFICRRYDELALFSAVTRKRPPNSTPDYYKAVGNYLCLNGSECNRNITDPSALESFIRSVLD
ncbi:FusB/FusC family EF-G-binding protein [Cohnella hongkongensis]|uniref:FusB/FusC family EF-G-binding protein n=1 Tax=Cohnella hongkongensis TaxID=178337 RepID=A0ABV9F765_9BACL